MYYALYAYYCIDVVFSLLITLMGHIKLTDFGLSKMGLMNRKLFYIKIS